MAKPHEETFARFLKDPGSIVRALRSATSGAHIWTELQKDGTLTEIRQSHKLAPVEGAVPDFIARFHNGTEAMAILAYVVIHDGFNPFKKA